ncbi:ankyrin-3 [Nephila pilipes]|uniref:Alpha-latrotoxin n=1 Tax=Nephila pilipes TaxID=299642 RepID=A0A8X6QHL4_NEPPI|nr:ankyrin-3 [Nephila pilipes]
MASHDWDNKDTLLTLSISSRERHLKIFRSFDEAKAKEYFLKILDSMKHVARDDTIDIFKNLTWLLLNIESMKSENDLQNFVEREQIGNFNLVALACQKKAIKILEYLFSDEGKFLYKLIVNICESDCLLSDNDEFCHNAFYYAIRSNQVDLLRILVDKWCEDKNSEQLEDVLSKEYKELKLRRVFLTNEMELHVRNKILDIRFFQDHADSSKGSGNTWSHIKKRIEMVHRDIKFLKTHYWDSDPNDKFLVKAEFIAKNIHVLKSLLKSTYDKLPWEEIEFILVIFILCCKNRSQTNLVYNSVLNKKKVLSYLESFSVALGCEQRNLKTSDVRLLAKTPGQANSIREKVIKDITKNYPTFQALFIDYETVRDFYSLETVKNYVDLAVTVDVTEKEGQLVVMRALQVMGEHFKHTLESPKLSDSTAELLLYSLPLSTREVIINLRDSLSHEFEDDTHFIRTIIEKKPHLFFKNIQTDISKISVVITDFFYKIKTKAIQLIMTEVRSSKNLKDVEDAFIPFRLSFNSLKEEIKKTDSDTLIKGDIGKLEELLLSLSSMMIDKTTYEKGLFEQINSIIEREKHKLFRIRNAFMYNANRFNTIFKTSHTGNASAINILREFVEICKNHESEVPTLYEELPMRNIGTILQKILESCKSRIEMNNDILSIIMRIDHFMKFHMFNIKWINEFKGTYDKKKMSKAKTIENLSLKLTILKKVLNDNDLIGSSLVKNISFFESNVELQTVIEMLVLDVLSVLQDSCNHNPFFLDSEYPLQIGKNLRNHLAHNNALINILLGKSPIQLLLSAVKITSEEFSKEDKKLDKIILCDPSKLENNHTEDLLIVDNQRELFYGLENGDMKRIQDCIKKGADIYGKDINEMTCLHYSAKAPSTEGIEFVLQQGVNVASKDLRGQTALHIAVKYDRINTVNYFIETECLCLNDEDINGKTPLHIAVENGSINSLKYLLKNEVITTIRDYSGFSPLHTAILLNEMEMVEIFLQIEKNINETLSPWGFTTLHRASQIGQISLINKLIGMKVDVDSKTEIRFTPLHIATLYGHIEVVKTLIQNGADVNAKTLLDETPLHYAADRGDKKIVEILLNHKAEINAYTLDLYRPFSYAAVKGHVAIAELLLKNNDDVNTMIDLEPSPLQLASKNGHLEFVELLLNHGALINHRNENKDNGLTALHYSSGNGHFEIMKILIERGADIEVKDFQESTPLHLAAKRGHYDIVVFLIARGADIYSRNSFGWTALHIAAYYGFEAIVTQLLSNGADIRTEDKNNVSPIHLMILNELSEILIKRKANVDFVDDLDCTALHLGAISGNLEFVKYCLENGCNIDAKNSSGFTALHLAVQGNHKEVVSYLVENGAKTNIKDNNGFTALFFAIKNNDQNITSILIEKTAPTFTDQIDCLYWAVSGGRHDIVRVLFKECKFDVRLLQEKHDFLHIAAENGHIIVVKILLENGFEIDAKGETTTPLHCAIFYDQWETAQLFLLNEANPNARDQKGLTPLHIAVMKGNTDVVEILLEKKADIFIKDYQNNSVIDLAVCYNQLDTVKLLLMNEKIDVNVKGYLDRTLLHYCALTGSLEMTEYLVKSGANIHARCRNGHKPIHLAAAKGFVKIVEFYLDHNVSVNDWNGSRLTLLHIAAKYGKAKVAELMVQRSAYINAFDINGKAPIHLASANGHKDVLEILLHNSAYYNIRNNLKQTPLQITTDKSIASIIENIERLFISVKKNSSLDIETQLDEAAKNSAFSFINANCVEHETLLHYAARNGYEKIIESLLKHKANPNVVNKNNCTPLHYAAKFSYFGIVKILLSNGAIYNSLSYDHITPLLCSANHNVIKLLDFLNNAFIKTHNDDSSVLQDLEKLTDLNNIKALMRAKNRDGKTLIEFAILCNFSKTEQLKKLFQGDIKDSLELAETFCRQYKFMEASCAYRRVINKRIEIFGLDNPSVLDIQEMYVTVLNMQNKYVESLQLVKEIYRKRQESLGPYHKFTLAVKSLKAITLCEQEKNEEALNIFKEVVPKQKEILDKNDFDILESENFMALVLFRMRKFAEACKIGYEFLQKCIKTFGEWHENTLSAHHNLAATLIKQGKYAEGMKHFEKAYVISNSLFTLHNSRTLNLLINAATALISQKKYHESLKRLRLLLGIQKICLAPNDPDILNTVYNIGVAFLYNEMTITALRIFLTLEPKIKMVCPNIHIAKDNKTKIEEIFSMFQRNGLELVFERIQNETKGSIYSDTKYPFGDLISVEEDIDSLDSIGITALHLAVVKGDKNRINDLLENGFDVLKVTIEGNTALHTAAINGYADIAEIIIKHTIQHNRLRLSDLINATTTGARSTALHVAANVDTAMCLLKHGAMFDAKNKLDQTPLDLAGDERVFTLLKTITGIFDSAVSGKCCVIDRIRELDPEEALATSYARNTHGHTLLQVALMNNHRDLAKELGEFLKTLTNKI